MYLYNDNIFFVKEMHDFTKSRKPRIIFSMTFGLMFSFNLLLLRKEDTKHLHTTAI